MGGAGEFFPGCSGKCVLTSADLNTDGDHRYLLFSATFPKRLRKLAGLHMAPDHIHISIGRTGSVHTNVKQHVRQHPSPMILSLLTRVQVMWTDPDKKTKALYDLLITMPPSRTLVFVRSKKTADFVDDFLFNNGLPSTSIHSDRTQREREDAL